VIKSHDAWIFESARNIARISVSPDKVIPDNERHNCSMIKTPLAPRSFNYSARNWLVGARAVREKVPREARGQITACDGIVQHPMKVNRSAVLSASPSAVPSLIKTSLAITPNARLDTSTARLQWNF